MISMPMLITKNHNKPSLNPALRSFWQTQSDLKVLKGGRASSKTWDTAGHAVRLATRYKIKFLCVRQFQNKIEQSVYAVLKIQIERFGLEAEFDIQKTVITHKVTGSSFHFYGIHRNIAEIKGFEGADVLWIEEGEGLTLAQWEIINPTVRGEGGEIWLLYNPRLATDFVESHWEFKHDPDNGVIVRHINYDENPFISTSMLRKIKKLKDADYDEYEHIYLGIARNDDDLVVIKRSWIEAAIDAHLKLEIEPTGGRSLGFDVADSGKDLCSQIYREGIVAIWGEHWKAKEDELMKSCKRVYSKAIELAATVTYDSIGVGATCGSKFDEMNKEREAKGDAGSVSYSKFVAGGAVHEPDGLYIDAEEESITNKDFFENLKAQTWWIVADRFRNTYNAVHKGEKFDDEELISISSDMPTLANLVTELSTPRRDFAKGGKIKVESKEDLAKREIPSPNDADAFIMAYADISDNMNFAKLLELAIGD